MPIPSQVVRTLSGPQLGGPSGLAIDVATGRLFVSRPLADVVAWADVSVATPAFATLGMRGTNPAAEGFATPVALAVQAGGHLLVLDAGNNEIDRYTAAGGAGGYTYDTAFLGGNRSSFAGATVSQPTAMTLVGTDLYVLDSGHSRVVRLDVATGTSSLVIADPSWAGASGIAVMGTGVVFVSDTFNNRVLRYAAAGASATVVAGDGTAAGKVRQPRGLALDAQGNLFVADSGNQRVQMFDTSGAYIATVAPQGAFVAIRGVAFDAAGHLYVSDFSQNRVIELATAGSGPVLRFVDPVREFGSVGVGYGFDRPVLVANDGSAPLSVTVVTSASPLFIPSRTSFQVAPGATFPLVVRFAPTVPGFTTATLACTSDSVTGPSSGCVLRGTGHTPPLVDAVLILDQSGSMLLSAGTQSKMAALQQAASLFVDLARAGLGDRLGVVAFDHMASTAFAVAPVSDMPPSSRAAARTAIDALGPRGATSIGGGMERARADLNAAAAGTHRQVLVVVTDGMENTAPWVKGGPSNAQRVDLAQYAGMTIYTVGLGLGTTVDLGVLTSLASTFRGAFHLTEDRWLTLPKFFVEIFGDSIDEFVALDPNFEVVGKQATIVEFDLVAADTGATVAAYWNDPALHLDLEVITPAGFIVSGATPAQEPTVRYGAGRGYAFFRFPLPLPPSLGRAWEGRWAVRARGGLPARQRQTFGLSVLVSSNVGLHCSLERDGDATGDPVALAATVTEYGNAIVPDRVFVTLSGPVHSRGDIIATTLDPKKPQTGAEVDTPTARVLAWAEANDERYRATVSSELDVMVDRASGEPVLRAVVSDTIREGAYEIRLFAELDRNGLVVRRECGHSFAAIAYASSERTEISTLSTRKGRYAVTFRPADRHGNILGPGLGPVQASHSHAKCSAVIDNGDGSYNVAVTFPSRSDASAVRRSELVVVIRGVEVRWPWREVLDGGRTQRKRQVRPQVLPQS